MMCTKFQLFCEQYHKNEPKIRNSRSRMFFKIGVLKNFAKFTGNFEFFKCIDWHRCFPVNFAKFYEQLFYRALQKQPPEVLYKKTALKNFAIFTGKYLCWSPFLIKLQVVRYLF